jgi:hypothetical protein
MAGVVAVGKVGKPSQASRAAAAAAVGNVKVEVGRVVSVVPGVMVGTEMVASFLMWIQLVPGC